MQITVIARRPDGNEQSMSIYVSALFETVNSLRTKIAARIPCQVQSIRLVYKGATMLDHRKLSEYNLNKAPNVPVYAIVAPPNIEPEAGYGNYGGGYGAGGSMRTKNGQPPTEHTIRGRQGS